MSSVSTINNISIDNISKIDNVAISSISAIDGISTPADNQLALFDFVFCKSPC